ncbi:hypothetical protein SteCoe_807 [Stentor coeruleus]|uniref:Uncharacterized protein n=1 Tax=Stentor coeruleus TaxID=5963 RepID=A0A1R2D3E7_9CILI|nr:hypothetical protein SteCoe_807 [Stentor coeruleus]
MEDLKLLKSWEIQLRKKVEGLKEYKNIIGNDPSIPNAVKERFANVLKTIKLNMIQIMAKCTALRTDDLPPRAFQVRMSKIKFEITEAKKSLKHLVLTVQNPPSHSISTSIPTNRSQKSYRTTNHKSQTHKKSHSSSEKPKKPKTILSKVEAKIETHTHKDIEQRLKAIKQQNQELHTSISNIQKQNSETFNLIHTLKSQISLIESSNSNEKPDLPKKRHLLQPKNQETHLQNQ